MDHRKLLDTFAEEIQGRVVRSAVGAACTVMRKQAKKNLNKVGRSVTQKKTYVTKDGPRVFEVPQPQNRVGRSMSTGTWEGLEKKQKTKRMAKRAASMPKKKDKETGLPVAEYGPKMSALGKSGLVDWLMTRYSRYNMGQTTVGVTGPAHKVAAQGHILEFGAKHVAWGRRTVNLPPRPFMRPAAQQTRNLQRSKIIATMKKWQRK